MVNLPPPPKAFVPLPEEKKDEEKEEEKTPVPLKDAHGRTLKAPEEKKDDKLKDARGQLIKEVPKIEPTKDVRMIQDGKSKQSADDEDKFVKH